MSYSLKYFCRGLGMVMITTLMLIARLFSCNLWTVFGSWLKCSPMLSNSMKHCLLLCLIISTLVDLAPSSSTGTVVCKVSKIYEKISQHLQLNFSVYSDRERVQENVKQRTVSLWSYINSSIDNYRNPLYLPRPGVLEPVASIRLISLWKGLYCRWNPGMRPQVW